MSVADLDRLTERLPLCMTADRLALARRMEGLRRRANGGKPIDRGLAEIAATIEASVDRAERRATQAPRPTYPEELPVSAKRGDIAEAIRAHQVVVIAGETGSGKTTQIPKICLDLGRGVRGMIGHTQPRRIAARSVATRIAEELQSPVGHTVGFKIRFSDHVSEQTMIKLLTDGMLLAEIQGDPLLTQYDTIVIDEAHERSLNIDFLLGYLKQLLPKRPDLKLIVTSATINTESFSRFFGGAPILEVSGRTYPVDIHYRPLPGDEEERDRSQVDAILDAVDEVTLLDPRGDILVFLAGEREIRETAEALRKHALKHTEILPLYSRLTAQEQDRVFKPHAGRRIVLATNVAETSLTVPGIRFVLDPGFARLSRYSHRTKVQRLPIEAVSQASANQRAGRCGRVGPGVCIRLYAEEDFTGRAPFTEPEILRTNLASVILQMAALGLGDPEAFPFLEPPDRRYISDGYRVLQELGAVDELRDLTEIGRKLSRLPVDPRIGRMLLAADKEHCVGDMLVIAAALAIQDPRERPMDAQQKADQAHSRFLDERSDFLSYLKLWDYYRERAKHLSQSKLRKLCKEEFLSYVRLREWHEIHGQLAGVVEDLGFHMRSALPRSSAPSPSGGPHGVGTNGPGRESEAFTAKSGAVHAPSPLTPGPHVPDAASRLHPCSRLPGGEGDKKRHIALPRHILQRARDLRRQQTDAEQLLWGLLRDRRMEGWKFRRQHPIDSYVLDFYCPDAHIGIELDGGQHNEPQEQQRDEKRSAVLARHGIRVLRFWNNQVLQETDAVLEAIWLDLGGAYATDAFQIPSPPGRGAGGEGAEFATRHGDATDTRVPASRRPREAPEKAAAFRTDVAAKAGEQVTEYDYEAIHRAILTGFLSHVAVKEEPAEGEKKRRDSNEYLGARNLKLTLFPGSGLAKKPPKWIVAAELVETARLFARTAAAIKPEWIEQLAPHLLKRHWFEPHWEKKPAQVAAMEQATLYGLIIVPRRRVNYGPIDPKVAREIFIREALVAGEFRTEAPFFTHNRQLIAEIEELEAKSRRRDLLVDEHFLFEFYAARLPHEVYDGHTLERWRREHERDDPHALFLRREDLMRHEAEGVTRDEYPATLDVAGVPVALSYHFEPGHPADGVTATLPVTALGQIRGAAFDWLVPGLLEQKLVALIKSLPKQQRRNFVPAPNFAQALLERIQPSARPLTEAMATELKKMTGVEIAPSDFQPDLVPPHLHMNFRVVDDKGKELDTGRDLAQLQQHLAGKAQAAFESTSFTAMERSGITVWDFEPLEEVTLQRQGITLRAYPAVVDQGEHVGLRVFQDPNEAEAATHDGLRRLFMLALPDKVKYLKKSLPALQQMCLHYAPLGRCDDLKEDLTQAAFDAVFMREPHPHTAGEFQARLEEGKARIIADATALAAKVAETLAEYHALAKALSGTIPPHRAAVVADVRAQLEALIYPGFIARTPRSWLPHLPRYLKAARLRLEKHDRAPEKDRQLSAELVRLWTPLHARLAVGDRLSPEQEEFRWHLEELRVSLFAQELKAVVPVSVQRLEKRWVELAR